MTDKRVDVREDRKPFVRPELRRESTLPEVTNTFFGSFDPGEPTQP